MVTSRGYSMTVLSLFEWRDPHRIPSGCASTLSQIKQCLEPVGFSGLQSARVFSSINQLELALVVSKTQGAAGEILE